MPVYRQDFQRPKKTLKGDELDYYYHDLAQAVITQAVEDVRTNTERIDALLFLYGPGLALAQLFGIDSSAMQQSILRLSNISPRQIAAMKPPEEIRKPPLFQWKKPCNLCQGHGQFDKPYHVWLHWKSRHSLELKGYVERLIDWVDNGPGTTRDDRVEVLSIFTRIEKADLYGWIERARQHSWCISGFDSGLTIVYDSSPTRG